MVFAAVARSVMVPLDLKLAPKRAPRQRILVMDDGDAPLEMRLKSAESIRTGDGNEIRHSDRMKQFLPHTKGKSGCDYNFPHRPSPARPHAITLALERRCVKDRRHHVLELGGGRGRSAALAKLKLRQLTFARG